MLHQPPLNKRFIAEWFLRAALNVTLDGSDDSKYQHYCVLDEPVRIFVSFLAHCSYKISAISDHKGASSRLVLTLMFRDVVMGASSAHHAVCAPVCE